MFEHSIRVPRLYKQAANILKDVKENRSSLKQLIYQCKHRNIKGVYALVAETIKHYSSIESVIQKSQLFEKENRFDPWLARILITELVWRGKQLASKAKPVEIIYKYYDSLKQHKDTIDLQTTDLVTKVKKPRFARINTLKITLQEAINAFKEEGWSLSHFPTDKYHEFVEKCSSLNSEEFLIDMHIKELLHFSSDTQFYKHKAYKGGYILLQDKASCLAAHLLNPTPGSTVLDMCAAPGMKTTHAAALLNNDGVVYAVERDEKRFNTLKEMIEHAGATCVKTIHRDAVELTAKDCPNVEYILVDPSCSGSGIVNRITLDNKQESVSAERLKKLYNFQSLILNCALSKFPQVKRIVYSTCSIFPEENQHVVDRVLQKHPEFKLVSARELLKGLWTNPPSEIKDSITNKCLFANLENDLTNGFFIAVIERTSSEDCSTNESMGERTDSAIGGKKRDKKKNRNYFAENYSNISCEMENNTDKNTIEGKNMSKRRRDIDVESDEGRNQKKKKSKYKTNQDPGENQINYSEIIKEVISNDNENNTPKLNTASDFNDGSKEKHKKKPKKHKDQIQNIAMGQNIVGDNDKHIDQNNEDMDVVKKKKKSKYKKKPSGKNGKIIEEVISNDNENNTPKLNSASDFNDGSKEKHKKKKTKKHKENGHQNIAMGQNIGGDNDKHTEQNDEDVDVVKKKKKSKYKKNQDFRENQINCDEITEEVINNDNDNTPRLNTASDFKDGSTEKYKKMKTKKHKEINSKNSGIEMKQDIGGDNDRHTDQNNEDVDVVKKKKRKRKASDDTRYKKEFKKKKH